MSMTIPKTETVYEDCNTTRMLTCSLSVLVAHIVGFRVVLRVDLVLRVVNSVSCRCDPPLNHYPKLLHFHVAKTCLLRCCLYTTRRSQQTAVSSKRSVTNRMNSWKSARLRFSPKICKQRVDPFDHNPLFCDFLWIHWQTTRNLAIATTLRRNSMTISIGCTSSKVWSSFLV